MAERKKTRKPYWSEEDKIKLLEEYNHRKHKLQSKFDPKYQKTEKESIKKQQKLIQSNPKCKIKGELLGSPGCRTLRVCSPFSFTTINSVLLQLRDLEVP
ncbi:hypothetical protein ABVT39_023223 [Epinephelus coioides]